MNSFLLDVNVLLALLDPAHVMHDSAHGWFERTGSTAWATCPITQNGVIRIASHPSYPNSPGPPAVVAAIITRFTGHPRHHFWPDDVSLLDTERCDCSRLSTAAQVTDTYLLALAACHEGKLATFDRRLSTSAVRNGTQVLCTLPAA